MCTRTHKFKLQTHILEGAQPPQKPCGQQGVAMQPSVEAGRGAQSWTCAPHSRQARSVLLNQATAAKHMANKMPVESKPQSEQSGGRDNALSRGAEEWDYGAK